MPSATRSALALLLAAPLAVSSAVPGRAQDAPPQDGPPLEAPGARDPWAHLAPGELPPHTAPRAEQAWVRLLEATLPKGADPLPVAGFDVSFDVVTKDGVQTNEARVRHRYLSPSFVRTQIEKSAREQGRGPDGYWLFDPNEAEGRRARALSGREYAEDRRSIDEALALSRNVVALADPRSLRLASLERLEAAPLDELPTSLRAEAEKLEWLAAVSPDFGLPASGSEDRAPAYEVRVGLDPESGRARVAIVRLADLVETATQGSAAGMTFSGHVLDLSDPRDVDGYRLPHRIRLFQAAYRKAPGEARLLTAVEPEPSQELWVVTADLAPELTPESFLPR